jgi:hypothetical protein
MSRPTIIAVNQTGSPITINDLGGVVIPANGQTELTGQEYGYSLIELQRKKELYGEIEDGNLLLSDGSRDFSKEESLKVLSPLYSLDAEVIKSNLNANRAPSVSDNSSSGYKVGSCWFYGNRTFKLVEEQNNQAIWKSDNVIQNISVNSQTKNKNTYTTLNKFLYDGSDRTLLSIDFVSYMDEDIDSYDVRVIDATNGSNIIAEKTSLTNTEEEIIDISTISNLPSGKSQFEVQVKKNNGDGRDKVYLDVLYLKFN